MNTQDFINHRTEHRLKPVPALKEACQALFSTPTEMARHGWAGPLQALVHNPYVGEIIIPHHGQVWVTDHKGVKSTQPIVMSEEWIRFLIGFWQQKNKNFEPILGEDGVVRDTFLFPSGDGVRYVYGPSEISAWGSSLYIRRLKFTDRPTTLDDIVRWETLSPEAAEMLRVLLQSHTPMLATGATGAGKTTLLAALTHEIQQVNELMNLLVIERSHEIGLSKRAFRWAEGRGFTLEHLAEKATQMGLDWLVLGECTGAEAYYVAKAYTQGVPVLSTLHAWDIQHAFKQLALLSQEHPQSPPTKAVMASMALLGLMAIQMERKIIDGRVFRRVVGIAEIIGVIDETPILNEWWRWDENSQSLRWNPGCINEIGPAIASRLAAAGLTLPIPTETKKRKKRR
ncbi:MAG: type II/IV secretion system ATPase subunit [Chloroflexi bacterium]|nr:type II/IV secretion system ATPase subunit [Chloroflexota bacterium]